MALCTKQVSVSHHGSERVAETARRGQYGGQRKETRDMLKLSYAKFLVLKRRCEDRRRAYKKETLVQMTFF